MVAPPVSRHSLVMIGVSPAHTSVPRWPRQPPGVDPAGTGYLVVSAGRAGAAVAAGWIREIQDRARPVWGFHDDSAPGRGDRAATALISALSGATVGVRIMVAGPELVVLDCAAVARAAGAIDAEITQHVCATELRRVHCSHCATPNVSAVAVGDTLTCRGCERRLVVYHHVSRRLGAYLGFVADAESPAR